MLRSLATSIVLVFLGGVVALTAGAASSVATPVRGKAVEDVVPVVLPRVDERIEATVVTRDALAAAAAAARARARWLHRLLAERRAAALRATRAAARRRLLISSGAEAWAHTSFAIQVANCESGGGPGDGSATYDGDPYLRDPNGHYGKWQFAPETWASVGGSGNPADASVSEQDYRAWLLWKRDGWGQWQCAS